MSASQDLLVILFRVNSLQREDVLVTQGNACPPHQYTTISQEDIFRLPRNVILSDTFVSLVRHYREYAANCLAKRSAVGMGNVGFGAGSASSEPVLALFPRLAADPALMMVRFKYGRKTFDARRATNSFFAGSC